MCVSTYRSGAFDTWMMPVNGPSSSRIRNTAAATENAEMPSAVITVALRGAASPKLANVIASQKITTPRNMRGTEPPELPSRRQRVRSVSRHSFSASVFNQRCVSVVGVSARI